MVMIIFYYASFSFFLFVDLYFLIIAVIKQILNLVTELVISIRIPTDEAKEETEIHLVTVSIQISKRSI